ncbi:hypothetical protein NEOLI_002517, partial [Neolecta irregularis DAH-3]
RGPPAPAPARCRPRARPLRARAEPREGGCGAAGGGGAGAAVVPGPRPLVRHVCGPAAPPGACAAPLRARRARAADLSVARHAPRCARPRRTPCSARALLTAQTIKLAPGSPSGALTTIALTTISPLDSSVAQLKNTQLLLHAQIDSLVEQLDRHAAKARLAVAKQQKTLALACLRSRRSVDAALLKRTDALDHIDTVLLKIEQALANVELVKAVETGTLVLENIMAQIGGIERVQDVMDQAKMGIDDVDEMGRVISQVDEVTDEELLDELAALDTKQSAELAGPLELTEPDKSAELAEPLELTEPDTEQSALELRLSNLNVNPKLQPDPKKMAIAEIAL